MSLAMAKYPLTFLTRNTEQSVFSFSIKYQILIDFPTRTKLSAFLYSGKIERFAKRAPNSKRAIYVLKSVVWLRQKVTNSSDESQLPLKTNSQINSRICFLRVEECTEVTIHFNQSCCGTSVPLMNNFNIDYCHGAVL